MNFLEKLDFAKGLKTLLGVIILSIPYLDEALVIGGRMFDVPDAFVAVLATPEMVAFATTLIVYGGAMKFVGLLKKIFPKK